MLKSAICYVLLYIATAQERPNYPDYIYYKKINGWIKLHERTADWVTAIEECKREDAALFYPWNDDFSNAALWRLQTALNVTRNSTPIPAFVQVKRRVLGPMKTKLKENGKLVGVREYLTHCVAYFTNQTESTLPCDEKHRFLCFASQFTCDPSGAPNSNVVAATKMMAELDLTSDIDSETAIDSATDFISSTSSSLNDTAEEAGFRNETDAPLFNSEYMLNPGTNTCYKVYVEAKTWDTARQICQADGGDLVVMKILKEAKFVKKMYARHHFFIDTSHSNEFFVGIYEKNNMWTTINDESLKKAGFSRWSHDKPGGKTAPWPEEFQKVRRTCGAMDRQGWYSDCWCNYKHPYVCKKNAYKL